MTWHQSSSPQMFNSPWQLRGYLIWSHCSCWVELWELRKQCLLDSRCPGNLQAPRMNGGEQRRWDHHYLVSLLLSRLPLRPTIRMPRCVTCWSALTGLPLRFLSFFSSSCSRSWIIFKHKPAIIIDCIWFPWITLTPGLSDALISQTSGSAGCLVADGWFSTPIEYNKTYTVDIPDKWMAVIVIGHVGAGFSGVTWFLNELLLRFSSPLSRVLCLAGCVPGDVHGASFRIVQLLGALRG